MLHRITRFTLALIASISVATASASDSALDSLVSQLADMSTFEADFIQSSRAQNGDILQQMQGKLSVAKPGKMRWETQDPYAQLVVSDGALLWIYDMDLEQVTIRNMDNRIQETPALLLSGNSEEIDANFVVSREGSDEASVYQLVPKDPSQLFQSLEFHYSKQIPAKMMIYDAAGQVTEILFSAQRANQRIDGGAFIFDVPEGVDVIDGRSAL
jgi:outer membrane lipoprotein carrier protein